MTTRIYVDWSGDPGFKFRQGSSELLVIAAVMADEEPITGNTIPNASFWSVFA